jgi:hypothetical protein
MSPGSPTSESGSTSPSSPGTPTKVLKPKPRAQARQPGLEESNPFLVQDDLDRPASGSRAGKRADVAGKMDVEDVVETEAAGDEVMAEVEEDADLGIETVDVSPAEVDREEEEDVADIEQIDVEDEAEKEQAASPISPMPAGKVSMASESEKKEDVPEEDGQEERQQVDVEHIAQTLGGVTLASPIKSAVEQPGPVEVERLGDVDMQVDLPMALASTPTSSPSSPIRTSPSPTPSHLLTSEKAQDDGGKTGRTDYMIPLRDSTTPVKSASVSTTRTGTDATTARKSIYGAERQTPISFSPSSVAFAALPSRDPMRGKSIGGQKRMTMNLEAGKKLDGGDQEKVDEGVDTDGQDKAGPSNIKSVRLAPVVSLRQVDAGPVSAPAATPAPISRHTASQGQDQKAGPGSQGNGKKSGPGVRSSWLRQAMANAGGEQGVRKSMAGHALRKKSEFERDVEEEEEEVDEVHDDVVMQVEPVADVGKEKTEIEKAASVRVTHKEYDVEIKDAPKSSAEGKPAERQPLETISVSRHINQPVPLEIPAESMPQSKLARMIADLEEKKAAASLAATNSRMTLGGPPMNGAHHGILGGGAGWNPLRSTLGGLRLRDEAAGSPKGENGPISLLPRQEALENKKSQDESEAEEELEADEADEQEGFSKRTAVTAVVEAAITDDAEMKQAQGEEVVRVVSERKEVTATETREEVVIVEVQQEAIEVISTTPTAPVYPVDQHAQTASQVTKEEHDDMHVDHVEAAPTTSHLRTTLSTPVKQDLRVVESTTPMVSPPRAFRAGAFAPHQARGPSHLQNAALPPVVRQPKISMMRIDSAEDIKVVDKLPSREVSDLFSRDASASRAQAQTPPSQPPYDAGLAQNAPTIVTKTTPRRSGLSASTAQVVPDDDDDDVDEDDAETEREEVESSSEEEEENEQADEFKEDIEEAVALITKEMRLGDEETDEGYEAPSDGETVTEKTIPAGKVSVTYMVSRFRASV